MADALLETTIAARGKLDALDLLSLSLRLGAQVENLQQRLAQALLDDGDPGMPPGELLAAQRLLRAVSPEMQIWCVCSDVWLRCMLALWKNRSHCPPPPPARHRGAGRRPSWPSCRRWLHSARGTRLGSPQVRQQQQQQPA
jgi:hypothetical protein